MKVAFQVKREPFTVRLDGDTVRMTAILSYAGRVWYNPPLAPELSASCGVSGAAPRARIEVVTPLRLSNDWKLRSRTRVRTVEAFSNTERDQCEVTALKIDVTGRVIDAARKLMESKTKYVDAQVASIDVRSKFEEWWSVIQQPIRLTDTVWLAINPKAVHVGAASGSRKTLRTGIDLTAQPRIIVGKRPAIPPIPLPRQIAPSEAERGFHMMLEGVLSYDVASKLLTEELQGEKIGKGGRSVEVRTVRMFGLGGGKVALEIGFAGAARGHIFFVGTPHYDYAGDRLYVPDLDYDVASANMLVRGLAWLKHDDLRNYLRTKARWPVGGLIHEGRDQLISGLNRELSPGVRLSGEVHDVEIMGVRAAHDAVRVRAHTDGSVRLNVGK